MSRGLSQQQRRILGLGVRVNRAVNGGVVVPLPGEPIDSFEDWRWPVLVGSPGLPEVHPALVMHLCHGVPLAKEVRRAAYTRTWDRGYASEHTVEIAATTVSIGLGASFAHTPQTLSLRASTQRAIGLLRQRGYLVAHLPRSYWPDVKRLWFKAPIPGSQYAPGYREKRQAQCAAEAAWYDGLPDDEALTFWSAYALTPSGIEVGSAHEPELEVVDVLETVRRVAARDGETSYRQRCLLRALDTRIADARHRLRLAGAG